MIEKTLCRIYLFKLRDKKIGMHLLPFCFDKLKLFMKERKLYRYWFNQVNAIME